MHTFPTQLMASNDILYSPQYSPGSPRETKDIFEILSIRAGKQEAIFCDEIETQYLYVPLFQDVGKYVDRPNKETDGHLLKETNFPPFSRRFEYRHLAAKFYDDHKL